MTPLNAQIFAMSVDVPLSTLFTACAVTFLSACLLCFAVFRAASSMSERRKRDRVATTENLGMQKLASMRNLWEKIVNLSPVLFYLKDVDDDFRIIFCNEPAAKFFSKTPDEIKGLSDTEIFTNPNDARLSRANDILAANSPDGMKFEESAKDSNGVLHHFQCIKKPFFDIDGKRILLCAISDVTELAHRISCEQANCEILEKAVAEPNLETVLDDIADIIFRKLEGDRIAIIKFGKDGKPQVLREWCVNGMTSLKKHDLAQYLALWDTGLDAMRRDKIVCISDIPKHLAAYSIPPDPLYRPVSIIFAPIKIDGEFCGSISVAYARTKRAFTDVDVSTMRSCADVIELSEIRNRLNSKVRKAEYEKNVILDNVHIPIWLFDGQGELLRANGEVGKLVNVEPDSLTTIKNRSIIERHLTDGVEPPVTQAIKTRKRVSCEFDWDGKKYMVDAYPVFDANGNISYVIKSAVDVTHLNVLIENEKITNFCLEKFFREEDVEKAISGVMEAVCHYMKADRVFVMRFDADRHVAIPHLEYIPDDSDKFMKEPMAFSADEKWFKTFSEREPIFLEDSLSEKSTEMLGSWAERFALFGVKSIAFTGLFAENKLYADFGVVYRGKSHAISEYEKNFLRTAGQFIELLFHREQTKKRLVSALEKIRKSAEEKALLLENEQLLNQGMNAVLSTQNPLEAMSSVLKLICKKFGASRIYVLRYDYETRLIRQAYEYRSESATSIPFCSVPIPLEKSSILKNPDDTYLFIEDAVSEKSIAEYKLWYNENKKIGVRSVCLSAIKVGGKIWGNFGLTFEREHHVFTVAERDFLISVTRILELMIQQAHYRDQIIDGLERAKSADKAKSFFVASISHEIRTPLNSVIGFAELLKDRTLDETTRDDYLDAISYSGNALLQLVNDVLDLSSLEAGKMQLVAEDVDFEELAEEVLKVFEIKAYQTGIKLIGDISDMPMLKIDKLRVRQILFNLVGNAVKFTRRGSVTLRARFKLDGENEGILTFSVIDTGIGISESDRKKLMQPFVQLSKLRGTNSGNNGTGLGLAISKRLTEKMEGKLSLKSELGQGSEFTAEIKVGLADKPKSDNAKIPTMSSGKETSFENVSVLLVDDVKMNLKVLDAVCRKAGVAMTTCAESGAEALELLEHKHFDALFTDMWMPEMSGAELVRKIRSEKRFDNLAIYAVTADVDVRANFPVDEIDGILYKPITIEKISETLRSTPKRRDMSQ